MDRVKKMVHYWCDDIKKAGLTGKGVTVAVLDTGLAPHPDFKSRVVGWRDCIYRKEKMLIEAVEHLWDLGLVVVVSSGNNGPGEGTIAIPGNSRKVITVGAVKTEKAEKGSCSGAGPTKECVVKPDVIAPGYQIISCNSQIHGKKDAYTVKSGSSMATPVVSGAVALLMEKYPRITNVEVKLRLRETCIHLPGAGEQGWGMLNIRDFLKL